MRPLLTVWLCLPLVLACGCGKDKSATQATGGDKDAALRAQLVGVWERPWDAGPVGYVRQLNADGSLVMDELRDPNASPASAAAAAKIERPRTMKHPIYNLDLKTCGRQTGTWAVAGGNLVFTIPLASGDPLHLSYKVERVTSVELVLSSTGVEGKTEAKFRRGPASKG